MQGPTDHSVEWAKKVENQAGGWPSAVWCGRPSQQHNQQRQSELDTTRSACATAVSNWKEIESDVTLTEATSFTRRIQCEYQLGRIKASAPRGEPGTDNTRKKEKERVRFMRIGNRILNERKINNDMRDSQVLKWGEIMRRAKAWQVCVAWPSGANQHHGITQQTSLADSAFAR